MQELNTPMSKIAFVPVIIALLATEGREWFGRTLQEIDQLPGLDPRVAILAGSQQSHDSAHDFEWIGNTGIGIQVGFVWYIFATLIILILYFIKLLQDRRKQRATIYKLVMI